MGKFGTAIAHQLDKTDRYNIKFYTRNESVSEIFNETKSNPRSFSDYKFRNSEATSDMIEAVSDSSVIFLTISSNDLEDICTRIADIVKRKIKIVICSKGLSDKKPYFYSEVLRKIFRKGTGIYVFSGPNFADEIIKGDLSITTIAGKNILKTKILSLMFRGTNIKTETTTDIKGVQILGAMKNVMAIAVGILEGIGCGKNRTIMTIMSFVNEIQKLNKHYKAKKNTAYLSAGIGDIMLTCFDNKSRNRTFGLRIGLGDNIESLLTVNLVEGYYAIKAIRNMSHSLKRIDKKNLVYINALYDVLYKGSNPDSFKKI